MLTLFSIPKPFAGRIDRLQRNAIGSWRALGPEVEILLLGDEPGVRGCAEAVRAHHLPNLLRTEAGTPRVDEAFRLAEIEGRGEILAYVNADVLLMGDFVESVLKVSARFRRFLMVGCRWDVDLEEAVDFSRSAWREELRARVRREGSLHAASGIDFFVFRRGLWKNIPPFAVGRTMWDNWLIFSARASGTAVVDATWTVMAVHQNHDYGHHAGGWQAVWEGPEADRNLRLAGGLDHFFTVSDATHRLTRDGVRRCWDWPHLRRRWQTLPALWPPAGWLRARAFAFSEWIYVQRVRVARWRGRVR